MHLTMMVIMKNIIFPRAEPENKYTSVILLFSDLIEDNSCPVNTWPKGTAERRWKVVIRISLPLPPFQAIDGENIPWPSRQKVKWEDYTVWPWFVENRPLPWAHHSLGPKISCHYQGWSITIDFFNQQKYTSYWCFIDIIEYSIFTNGFWQNR